MGRAHTIHGLQCQAVFRKFLYFLIKILHNSRFQNERKILLLASSAAFLVKSFNVEQFTALRQYAVSMAFSIFLHYSFLILICICKTRSAVKKVWASMFNWLTREFLTSQQRNILKFYEKLILNVHENWKKNWCFKRFICEYVISSSIFNKAQITKKVHEEGRDSLTQPDQLPIHNLSKMINIA